LFGAIGQRPSPFWRDRPLRFFGSLGQGFLQGGEHAAWGDFCVFDIYGFQASRNF